jgi:mannosyltransferase OCH1-like enzyme
MMIVHQTWKNDTVPDHWKPAQKAWKEFAKKHHWGYKLWTDEDNRQLIENYFPGFLDTYDQYPQPIMRADAIRPFILYKYGGLYVDLDIAPKDNFIHLFRMYQRFPVVLCHARKGNAFSGNSLTNAIMWSNVPRHPFWDHVCHVLQSPFQNQTWRKFVARHTNYFKPLLTTGPAMLSLAFKLYNEKTEHKTNTESNEIACVPSDLVQPYSNEHDAIARNEYTTDQAVITTYKGGSWHDKDAKFFIGCGKGLSHLHWVVVGLMLFFFITTMILLRLWIRAT